MAMMEQDETTKNKPLNIDWDKLFGGKETEPPLEIIVQPSITISKHFEMDSDRQHLLRDECQKLNDAELDEKIRRMKQFYETKARYLPDNGHKYLRNLDLSMEERESRKLRRVEKVFLSCFDSESLINYFYCSSSFNESFELCLEFDHRDFHSTYFDATYQLNSIYLVILFIRNDN